MADHRVGDAADGRDPKDIDSLYTLTNAPITEKWGSGEKLVIGDVANLTEDKSAVEVDSYPSVADRDSLMVEPLGAYQFRSLKRDGPDDHRNAEGHRLLANELLSSLACAGRARLVAADRGKQTRPRQGGGEINRHGSARTGR